MDGKVLSFVLYSQDQVNCIPKLIHVVPGDSRRNGETIMKIIKKVLRCQVPSIKNFVSISKKKVK